jgi:hypothetical protein
VGKEKMQMDGFLSYAVSSAKLWPAPLILLCGLGLAGCANDTTYAGNLEPLGGACDAANRATLQRHGSVVQFTPQDGVLTLDGTITAAGQVTAAQQTLGMDRKPYRLAFNGQLVGSSITGTYVTPRCRYHTALHLAK